MRWRVILGISLIANLILAFAWFRSGPAASTSAADSHGITNSITATNVRTAVIVRRQFFSWQELESRDYPTYIKNLRDIGCPEQTIRDIIIADVTAILREKYQPQAAALKPNPRWWTNIRDVGNEATAANPANAASNMWAERDAILKQLLGSDWAIRAAVPAQQTNTYQAFVLATMEVNPILQGLTADKKQALAALLAQRPDLVDGNGEAARNVQEEKSRWAKISELLSLDQLEAAKLHFSTQAENLRDELDALPGFNTQPEEFRKIFKATEAIDEQLLTLDGNTSPEAQQAREKLQHDRQLALRTALAPERYEQYVRLQDPAYLNAIETMANGGNTTALKLLYAINREASAEQNRIMNDDSLTEMQREIELKKLELEQLKATAQVLGEKLSDDTPNATPAKPEPMKVHSVAAGEGLERIARIYGVDPNALRAANPNINFEKIQAGTSISVPLRLIYPLPPPAE